MNKIRIGAFPHNKGGDCLQDIAIKINDNFEELANFVGLDINDPDNPDESSDSKAGIGKIKIIDPIDQENSIIILNRYIKDKTENKINYLLCVKYNKEVYPITFIKEVTDATLTKSGYFLLEGINSNKLHFLRYIYLNTEINSCEVLSLTPYIHYNSNTDEINSLDLIEYLSTQVGSYIKLYDDFTSTIINLSNYIITENVKKLYFQIGFVLYEVMINTNETYIVSKRDLTNLDVELIEKTLENKMDKPEDGGYLLTDEEKVLIGTIENKVDKVQGKGLSSNDFTDDYKNKVDSL